VEWQMAITLPVPSACVLGIALSRGQRNFSERDRLCLNVLRSHLQQALHNAEAFTRVPQALHEANRGLIALTVSGHIQDMTDQIRQWLEEYFGELPQQTSRLPESLQRWVAEQRSSFGQDDVPPLRTALTVERAGKRLVVRLVAEGTETPYLVLHEQRTVPSAASLQTLGLSQRQAEVLFWVAQGKTNAEVGVILDLSVGTVRKHLEHIYQKLDVDNRGAAAYCALETLGIGCQLQL